MVVQHNLTAMNSNRMLGITTSAQAKSTEKLSSGYKINRAADDAAGLSISEKMRKQIRGLTQASLNAEDGISSVQTAEGALAEVHDMLQRMNELAVKAANGTNSESDRQTIQDEIDQLTTEIDRVAETTKFNEIYLLKGNAQGTTSDMLVNAHDAGLAGKLVDNGNSATFTLDSQLNVGDEISIAGETYTIGNGGASAESVENYKKVGDTNFDAEEVGVGDSIKDDNTGITYTIVNKVANPATATDLYESGKSQFKIVHSDGSEMTYDVDDAGGEGKISAADAKELVAQELEAGSKVYLTKDGDGEACNVEIVEKLVTTGKNQEISIMNTNFADETTVAKFETATGITLAEGDTVTIGGSTTTFTEEEPVAAADIADIIAALEKGDTVQVTRENADGTAGTAVTYTVDNTTDVVNNKYTVADLADLIQNGDKVKFTIAAANVEGTNVFNSKSLQDGTALAQGNSYTVVGNVKADDSDVISKSRALEMIAEELQKASSIGTDTAATVQNNNDGTFVINKGTVEVKDDLNFNLHVGADADMTNKINVSLQSMSAAGLGIKDINVKDVTGAAATYAVDAIEDAIKSVSAQRSLLGAVQNRLEHTINNLDNIVENTTAAESQIRDTDMATEMVKYSNNNILAQAGQSMLAQANQANQGVLSLLG